MLLLDGTPPPPTQNKPIRDSKNFWSAQIHFFFLWLLPFEIVTADNLPPCPQQRSACPFYCMHKSSLWSSSSSCMIAPYATSFVKYIHYSPLHMSKPSEHCPSNFVFQPLRWAELSLWCTHLSSQSRLRKINYATSSLASCLQIIHHRRSYYHLVNLPFYTCCYPSVTNH